MKQSYYTKKIVMLLAVCALFLSGFFGSAFCEEGFGYKKINKEEEHKKYVARLMLDKAKVEKAILTTKTLIDKSTNRPYLPELYLRLSELYIEKSRIVYFVRKNRKGEGDCRG